MKDAKWAVNFIRKHGMGALCECGKEDAPCLGCQAVNVLEETFRAAITPSAEVRALREALEFYAEPQNQAREYHQSGCGITFYRGSPYSNDKGERARKALNQPHTGGK